MPELELIKVWEREEIVTELREALAILEEIDPPPDLRGLVLQNAIALTTQRVPMQRPGGLALPNLPTH